MATNQAAWLDKAGARLRVGPAEMPSLGPDSVIVRNYAVAVNPIDWKIQDTGRHHKEFPNILGGDMAGEVIEVGSNVTRFKKGDRVLAHDTSHNAFKLFASAPAATAAILPSSISYTDASVVPLALDTAATGLYSTDGNGMSLPYPTLDPTQSDKIIVVWGGSSSVGALTIQLAVASGAKVVAVASKHNFDFCKQAGASAVCDYNRESIVEDVVKAVQDAGGEFSGIFDTISVPDSYKNDLVILDKLGGGLLVATRQFSEEKPSNVNVVTVFAINPITHPVWTNYVTKALESGKLRCLPEPLVIGSGLESCQDGLDENKKGVSAKKVVIEL